MSNRFTEVSFLASITGYYGVTLGVGGPSMWVWGWLVSWVLITIVSYSMAEICSAYPSAGSVYHWAGQLTRHYTLPSPVTPVDTVYFRDVDA